MREQILKILFLGLFLGQALHCSSGSLSPQKRALTNSAIRAETAYEEGYPHVAISHWQEVIRKSQILDDQQNEALGHANLATIYINSGKMALAEDHLKLAQKLVNPQTNPEVYIRNAIHQSAALIHQEKFNEAQEVLDNLKTLL